MKKTIEKRIFAVTFSLTAFLSASVFSSFSAGEITATLHIEGINETLYYGEISVQDESTLQDALTHFADNNGIEFEGLDTAYITSVNGETAGAFGGWDGWLYRVNGVEATAGIDGYALQNGDEIVLFYGDPYGAGMQFPEIDGSRLSEGIVRFISRDTVYDEDFNPSVSVNPITGAEVLFLDENPLLSYGFTLITDENGEVTIPSDFNAEDTVQLYISKYDENGLPLVLRRSSKNPFTVKILTADNTEITEITETTETTGINEEIQTAKATEEIKPEEKSANPETGVSLFSVTFLSGITVIAFIMKPKLKK